VTQEELQHLRDAVNTSEIRAVGSNTVERLLSDRDMLAATLNALVDAWEALPGGRNYTQGTINRWLADDMKPAIDIARRVLGRELP
jgi:hypothetical protein